MVRKENQAKEQENIDAVKRRLQFEEKERKEEEKKNEKNVKGKGIEDAENTSKEKNVEVVSLFSVRLL